MIGYGTLSNSLAGRSLADCQCPECMADCSPHGQARKVLRLWRLSDRAISYACARCGASGSVTSGEANQLSAAEKIVMQQRLAEASAEAEAERERKRLLAGRLWRDSVDGAGTWAHDYLTSRNIPLPADPWLRRRTIRFHPVCPFPDKVSGPALIAAFTPILTNIPDNALCDQPIEAIHRIRGRGHANKAMLGPVKRKAVQFGEWDEVAGCGVLHVAEGVETALALLARGIRPIWATGSAGEMEAMPVVAYARRLAAWADNDESGRGIEAAERLATRYADAGKAADIFMPGIEGSDYGDV